MAFTLLFAPTIYFQRCSWLSSTIVTKQSEQKKCARWVCFAKNQRHSTKSQKLVCVSLRLQTDWLFTFRFSDFLNAHQPRRQSRYTPLRFVFIKRSRNPSSQKLATAKGSLLQISTTIISSRKLERSKLGCVVYFSPNFNNHYKSH